MTKSGEGGVHRPLLSPKGAIGLPKLSDKLLATMPPGTGGSKNRQMPAPQVVATVSALIFPPKNAPE
jgi:hypothetical protein